MLGAARTLLTTAALTFTVVSAGATAAHVQAATSRPGSASTSVAAPGPLRHGPLVFGESRKADVERFLGEPLRCAEARKRDEPETKPAEERIEICGPARMPTVRYPMALFVGGVLRMLRYQLAAQATPDATVRGLALTYGPMRKEGWGKGRAADLRYWEFAADPYVVVLSEVRSRESGEIALRLLLADHAGGWYTPPAAQ